MRTSTQTDQHEHRVDEQINNQLGTILRRISLLTGPVGAAIAMWIHPHATEDVFSSLSPVADVYVSAHLLLVAALALVAVGLYQLTIGLTTRIATIARAGIGIFAFFYLGFVAIVGLAKGLVIREGQSLPAAEQAGVVHVVQYLHGDTLLFYAGVIGVLGYLVAVIGIAIAYYRAGAPRLPIGLVIVSIIPIGAHSGIIGVAGMASFLLGAGWLEFSWQGPSKTNRSSSRNSRRKYSK